RLWPRSRQLQPKQFADITGVGRTMIQATADRLQGLVDDDQLYVVTGANYQDLTANQLSQIPAANILAEPCGRNSGPAIGLVCLHIYERDPDAVVAILPADHVIVDVPAFQAALRVAEVAAQEGYLVTLGITPDFPHTGYGYIKCGDGLTLTVEPSSSVYTVEQFLEKPNQATATAFLAEGNYFWNGGIFICRAAQMLAEMERQLPEVYAGLQQIRNSWQTTEAEQTLAAIWPQLPNVSIDYGVMEGAERVAMTPLQAGWNDVGSWDALESILVQDAHQNFIAKGETVAIASQGNIVYSEKRIVALVGAQDLVIVDTGDTLLVGHKSQMQKVKEVVEYLRSQGRTDLL
ncbi:MAG: mannose-1-phosphate guanylyltransferase, partial [Chloroflexi bacterium]|nr:mannose-1-phosphate guanylyltransferase [Chloroflexota bacterium]